MALNETSEQWVNCKGIVFVDLYTHDRDNFDTENDHRVRWVL